MDNVGSRSDAGRLFQTRGPLMAKDQSPNIVLVDGTSSNCWIGFILSGRGHAKEVPFITGRGGTD